MNVGIPKELKADEHRVALPPAGLGEFIKRGHDVFVESGAGNGSGFSDEDYRAGGAVLLDSAAEVWSRADLVIKVKEPQAIEYAYLRPDLTLFTYLHLAAEERLAHAMLDSGVTGIAYETVADAAGRLPLLEPMSEVAGRMAAQVVSHYLEKPQGGRGILMGGAPGVAAAHIVILGGGTVGANAAKIALGMGARVTLLDINLDRLRWLDDALAGRFGTLYSSHSNISQAIQTADAIIGSVLIAGARAPMLVTRDMLPTMPKGSVIVDVAVDQGGCVETTRVTTHGNPTYVIDGVLHYGVANMPGAVPRTSSLALSNATLPYALKIADRGIRAALQADDGFLQGLNTFAGQCTHPAVADALALSYAPPRQALAGLLLGA